MWTVSLKCLETRTRVLTYYKEHSKESESTRCKTEHSDAKPKCKLHCILKANEFLENSICIVLFKTWFTCISIYNLNYNIIVLLFDNGKYSIFQSSEKKLISVSFGGLVLISHKQQPENSPCKLTSPWVAGKFQETGPFHVKCQFPTILWCLLMK